MNNFKSIKFPITSQYSSDLKKNVGRKEGGLGFILFEKSQRIPLRSFLVNAAGKAAYRCQCGFFVWCLVNSLSISKIILHNQYFCLLGITPLTPPLGSLTSPMYLGIK